MSNWKVPFLNDNMVSYAEEWWINGPHFKDKLEFKDPYEFDDELAFVRYAKGRSSITITLESTANGVQYDTTLGGFIDMINAGVLRSIEPNPTLHPRGERAVAISGKFGFAKRGTSVAVILIK